MVLLEKLVVLRCCFGDGDGSGGLVSENRLPMYFDHHSKTLSFSTIIFFILSFMHTLDLLFLVLPVMNLTSSCIFFVPLNLTISI